MQDNKVLDVLWTRKGFTDDFKLNLNSLAHNQVLRQKDGEEIIIFCVQVRDFCKTDSLGSNSN
jgi:TusA-related sulfurtransferase